MRLQSETIAAAASLTPGTVDAQSHALGIACYEPLIVGMDALLRYAKAYRTRFDSDLADDYVLGPCWLDAIKGLHGLMDGYGAVAMEKGRTTDSKTNGALEAVYWAAIRAAGFTEDQVS